MRVFLFLVIGAVINLVLGCSVGAVFYALRDKALVDALGCGDFSEYAISFFIGLGFIGWIGAPLYAPDNSFEYTSDGKCSFGDFAWYELCIDFENGKVSKITSRWMYD